MALSPMMSLYLKTKEEYSDCIVFYRLGDFYEMFFDDAVLVSKELELTLTGKSCGLEERAPMCGVPYHSAEHYINRLVKNGHKVAICDQVEDPRLAKGLVKREVTRIVTPGTNLDISDIEGEKNNYIMSVFYRGDAFGVSTADVTTGDYFVTEASTVRLLYDEISKYVPSEIICNDAFLMCGIDIDELKMRLGISIFPIEKWYFDEDVCVPALKDHFHVADLSGLGLSDYPCGTTAAGALLRYLLDTQKNSLEHFTRLVPYNSGKYMVIDTSTRRNLELTETMREKNKRGSLFWVLDKTKTAMGARMLRSFIEQPLLDADEIIKRQDAIEQLNENPVSRDEIREYLGPVYDLERLIGRIAYRQANPRDLISFKNSLSMLVPVKEVLGEFNKPLLREICEDLDTLDDVYRLIETSICDDPPLQIKEGGIIKEGFNEEVDRLRRAKTDGKGWLASLEEEERERTGISRLSIKYNRVFGYYIEVTNSFKNMVPDDYIRKQTLTNAERYTTAKLKELEDVILGAEEKLFSLEYDLFSDVREKIAAHIKRIQTTAKAVARLDAFCSLAYVAERNDYVRPKINKKGVIDIKGGRHPVVERMTGNSSFVPNDTCLDGDKNRISIITGPNMAGKSTYMRQSALIVLMAQTGSFVPAASADICVCDRIFTRVGASDDLANNQSTFMVEMTEVANILRNATKDSLIILDEIGRGTSTFDGLAIAWAVVEHISDKKLLGAKTLFATHYHELTELEGTLDGVNNYCISVKEQGDDIIFLRKIIPGGADKSYGILVASLAGVPKSVTERAKEIAAELLDADIAYNAKKIAADSKPGNRTDVFGNGPSELESGQMSLFEAVRESDITDEIKDMDLSEMTPIEALNKLYSFQNMLKNRW